MKNDEKLTAPKKQPSVEVITFEELRPDTKVDQESYAIYLEEIYNDLCDSNLKGMSFHRFSDFLPECPVFVANKFFLSLCNPNLGKKVNAYLSQENFIRSALILKFGSFEEVARIVFNIFDFDMDGKINTQDIKLVISYLPLKMDKNKTEYYYQMESLKELDLNIAASFKKMTEISFREFLTYINNKANVFLIVFCYLYLAIPAMDKNLDLYKNKYDNDNIKIADKYKNKKTVIPSSSSSIFSPISIS